MEGLHTREAVGYPHVLAVVLSEEHTDYSPLGSLCLSAVVVGGGEEDERRDGDVAGHKRQRLSCGGGHLGDVDSVSPEKVLGGWQRYGWGLWGRAVMVVVVDAALRCPSKLSELDMVRVGQSSRASTSSSASVSDMGIAIVQHN